MAEQATINLNVRTDESQKSLRAMRQELKQLQIAMDAASDPAEFNRLAAEFASLRNDIGDTSQAMKYMDPGELLSGWTKFAQGAVGSFAAITGAMSLFGSESEEIQAIEKKSMSLIQTMMGLEQARQLLIDGGGRKQLAQLVATTSAQYKEIAAMVTKNLVIQTTEKTSKLAAAAQWLWNAAVTAFPIVALVAGVAALSLGVYKLIEAQKEQQSVLSASQDLQKKQGENAAAELVQMEALVKKLKDAKDNKKEYSETVRMWNEKYGKEYNASLSTTVFNLDAITNAANKAREAILKKALAAAAEEKLKEIVGDNIAKYETYVKATESLQLKKAALAKEEEMLQYFIAEGMDEAAAAQYAYIKSLKDKIAVGYDAYGLDKDYVNEIGVLTQIVADNTLVTQKQTTATKDYGGAVKDTSAEVKKLNDLLAEGVDRQDDLALYLSDEAKAALAAKKKALKEENDAALAAIENELAMTEFAREREEKIKDGWYADEILRREDNFSKRLEMLKDFHDRGLILEEDYAKTVNALIREQVGNYSDFINDVAGGMGDVFSNLTEMAQMELDAQDAAWQESHDARTSALDDELEKAEEVWGKESEQYKYLLEQQKKAEDDKAKHDEDIEKKRKAADSKYKKGAIASDMAQTTSEFAKATAGIWFTETGTKGVLGVPFAIAMQAVITGVYASQMALMAKQMGLVGKMRLGGPVFGPSHESGGVDRNLEGGEFVINAQSMKVPGVAQLANSLNRTGQGGSAPVVSRIDKEDISEIVGAIAAIPVVVSERDITGTQRRVAVIESKTSF